MQHSFSKHTTTDDTLAEAAVSMEIINALDNLDDAVVIFDADWRYQFVNKAARKVLNKKPNEALGHVVWELLPQLVDSGYWQAAHQAMSTQKTVEIEEFYPHFSEWYLTKFYPSQNSLVAQMKNITELKEEQRVNTQLSGTLHEAMEVYWHSKYGGKGKSMPA